MPDCCSHHEHDKYNGSHRARKSYHFIDGMIVCLGSDIENTNTEFPTETTIFQLAVTDKAFVGRYTVGGKDQAIRMKKPSLNIPTIKISELCHNNVPDMIGIQTYP